MHILQKTFEQAIAFLVHTEFLLGKTMGQFCPSRWAILMMNKEVEDAIMPNQDARRIYTGFPKLDQLLTGFVGGSLVGIAARPGMGKTPFVLAIARSMKLSAEDVVMFFSLEMSTKQVVHWLQGKAGGLNADTGMNEIILNKNNLGNGCIRIEDNPQIKVEDMLKICESTKNLRAVIVDYFQVIDHPAYRTNSKNRMETARNAIARELLTMARKLEVPVICTSQLPRTSILPCDGRENKHPRLMDLRAYGAFEQACDQVIFLYRDSHYSSALKTTAPNRDILECIVAKNCYGETGTVKLRWDSLQFALTGWQATPGRFG